MITLHNAIYALDSSVVTIRGDVAYDANENVVEYNKSNAEAKLVELETAETATKESALSKLTALGLTADEVKALLGVK